jgi:ArsR family transcriptional regulator
MRGIKMENYVEGAKIFKALGDPKRVMIFDMLSCGELCAFMILDKFEMSQSNLSYHMNLLCKCGLVKARNKGKWTYYSQNAEVVKEIEQLLHNITSDTEDCICKGKDIETGDGI